MRRVHTANQEPLYVCVACPSGFCICPRLPMEAIRSEIIQCSDGKNMIITAEDMQRVFVEMPTLKSLLLGHASMQGANVTVEDGTRTMNFGSEWNVPRDALASVISCALGIDDVPAGEEDRLAFFESLKVLGGWNIISRLKSAEKAKDRSKDPKDVYDDVHDLYEWRVLQTQRDNQDQQTFLRLQEHGFQYTKTEFIGRGSTCIFHLRRKRP